MKHIFMSRIQTATFERKDLFDKYPIAWLLFHLTAEEHLHYCPKKDVEGILERESDYDSEVILTFFGHFEPCGSHKDSSYNNTH